MSRPSTSCSCGSFGWDRWKILLKEEIPRPTTWNVWNPVNTLINYQPQPVIAGFLPSTVCVNLIVMLEKSPKVTRCSWSFIHESVRISLVFLHNILSTSFELMTDEPEESQRYLPSIEVLFESMRSVKFESGFDGDSYWNLQYFPTIMNFTGKMDPFKMIAVFF